MQKQSLIYIFCNGDREKRYFMICQQSSFWLSFALVELRGALYTCNSDKGHCSLRAKDCFRQGYFPRYTAVCNLLCYPIDFSTVLIITVQDDPTQFAVYVLRNKDINFPIHHQRSSISCILFTLGFRSLPIQEQRRAQTSGCTQSFCIQICQRQLCCREISFATSPQ